jgi:hypothetical protein
MDSRRLLRSRRTQDYYQLFGVAPDASLREIEQAYWQAAKERRELLPLLNEAYEVLGHADRRQAYDAQRVPVDAPAPVPTGSRPLRPNPDRNKLRWYLD